MRAREFLKEDAASVAQMQSDIIKAVKQTDDEQLLDKVYTALNSSGLQERIRSALAKNTDVRDYVNSITDEIIHTPGTYIEKFDFVNGYPHGYVDVAKMLSGERVKIEDLLTGGPFVHKVFHKLKQYSPAGVKGPGEFALAVLSPHIAIHAKGDLHIDGKVIELKASAGKDVSSGGGRLGTTGSASLVRYDRIPDIIQQHTGKDVSVGYNVGFKGLSQLCGMIPEDKDKKKFAHELFSYMFNRTESALESALVSGNAAELERAYLEATYKKYQEESKFDGLMIINFTLGELQYFKNAKDIFDNLYSTNVYFVAKDKGFSGRQIFPQITLRAQAVAKPPKAATKPKAKKEPSEKDLVSTINDLLK